MASANPHDTTANPAPLGLFGFGLTTVLLNLCNAGVFPLDAMILGMGIFYGGLAQLVVGVLEWRKGATFGTAAFTSYGLFWLTFVAMAILPKLGLAEKTSEPAWVAFLSIWGFLTLLLWILTFRINRALQVVFGLVVVLFGLLAAAHGARAAGIEDLAHTLKTIGGIEGVVCGLSAIYVGFAQMLNEQHGREVLPLWPMAKKA